MTVSQVSGANTALPVANSPKKPVNSVNVQPVTKKTTPDNVQISGEAKAKSLQVDGYSPSEIALLMGLSITTIDGYLSITPPKPTTYTLPTSSTAATKLTSIYTSP